ncbi:hypothetical protein APSETT444_008857 [Aspergillus pseudonomiae]
MPPRRPVSPLTLETCSPPTSDLDNSGLLGSDDELNDEELDAQRQRIEKLADQTTSFEHQDGSFSEHRTSFPPEHDGPDPDPLDVSRIPNSIASSPAKEQDLPGLGIEAATSGAVSQGPSFCVLAPSSHLPQFEYRRRKPRVSNETRSSKSPIAGDMDAEEAPRPSDCTKGSQPAEKEALSPQDMFLAHPNRHSRSEVDKDPKDLFISTSTTKAIGNISVSQSAKFRSTSTVNKGNTSERLPSAQQVRANPTMTDITSLHSIAVPRSNSEYDGDTIPDPQFSTQAALLHAQRSFQNDLDSPEHDIAYPERQHTPNSSNLSSPIAKDTTPFHRLSTPNRAGASSGVKAPMTAGQWQSTQCMIDAVTPFTFSTEKKPNHGKHDGAGLPSRRQSSVSLYLAFSFFKISPVTHLRFDIL